MIKTFGINKVGLNKLGIVPGASQHWTPQFLVVADATPTHVNITFPSAKTVSATEFTIAGFTVNSGSWSGSVYTLILSSAVLYGEILNVIYNTKSYSVTNSVLMISQYITYYNSLVTKPSDSIASAQNKMFKILVDGGVFAKRKQILLFAHNTSANALINCVTPGTKDATLVNSPSFIALEGFTGDITANNRYIRTHIVPSADGILQDDCGVMIYVRKFGATKYPDNKYDFGSVAYNNYAQILGGNQETALNNSSSEQILNDKSGVYHLDRSISTAFVISRDCVEQSVTSSSNGLNDQEIFIGCRNFQGTPNARSDNQWSYWSIGGSLTLAEKIIEKNAVEEYMLSNKKGVLNFTYEGDSLSGVYPNYLQTEFLTMDGINTGKTNLSVAGSKVSDLVGRAAALDAVYSKYNDKLIVMVGVNDFRYVGETKEIIYARAKAYYSARKAVGWKIYVLTMLPQSAADSDRTTYEAERQWYNSQIKSDLLSVIDGVIDVGGDATIGLEHSELNATYYVNPDRLHMTTPAGYTYLADLAYQYLKANVLWK